MRTQPLTQFMDEFADGMRTGVMGSYERLAVRARRCSAHGRRVSPRGGSAPRGCSHRCPLVESAPAFEHASIQAKQGHTGGTRSRLRGTFEGFKVGGLACAARN